MIRDDNRRVFDGICEGYEARVLKPLRLYVRERVGLKHTRPPPSHPP
jgi:hypothetical protein